jgi:hypothetical protein
VKSWLNLLKRELTALSLGIAFVFALIIAGPPLAKAASNEDANASTVLNTSATSPHRVRASDPSFKVMMQPLPLLVGTAQLDLSTRLADSAWSAGLYLERSHGGILTVLNGYGVGANTSYFFAGNPYRDSWYIKPELTYRWGEFKANYIFATGHGDYQMASLSTVLGYQWHWTSFNIGLGMGGAVHAVELTNVRGTSVLSALFGGGSESSTSEDAWTGNSGWITRATVAGEFTMGWSF